MSVTNTFTITQKLVSTELGDLQGVEDAIFHEMILSRHPDGYQIRLVFEKSIGNQHVISKIYPKFPTGLDIAYSQLGNLVLKIEVTEDSNGISHKVTLKNNKWFMM